MSELLPCPFCGSEAETTLRNIGDSGEYFWSIECFNHECGCDFCLYHTEAEAIAAWNSRAERTCKPVEKDGVMRCPDCDYPLGIMSIPAYCAGCGSRVVDE